VERGIGAGAGLFELLNLGIDLVEGVANGGHQLDGWPAGAFPGRRARDSWVWARVARARSRKAWLFARQGVGGEGFEGRLGFVLAPAEHQPRQGETGDKAEDREDVLHENLLSRAGVAPRVGRRVPARVPARQAGVPAPQLQEHGIEAARFFDRGGGGGRRLGAAEELQQLGFRAVEEAFQQFVKWRRGARRRGRPRGE